METASLIIASISLGIDITTIIGGFIKSNKTLNRLLNKTIKKARRIVNIDSQHMPGKPFDEKELDNELFDLVIKHAKGESIKIPNWLGDDFYIFYDAITQDVDFLEFLYQEIEKHQHSLQNEKLDEANKILKEICNQIELLSKQQLIENEKLDVIDKTTQGIKDQIEKPKIPDWLASYDIELSTNSRTIFLQDAHENLIRENKIYRKEDTIKLIKNWLDAKGVCLIIAPEGRGKTFLSRIIAFDYHENNTIVYFVDCRSESELFYKDMESLLFDWNKDKDKKYLLVLENVHACSKPELLKQTIENQTINQEETKTNIKFLLNARPTIVDYDCFTDWKETIKLHPSENDVQEIVNLYQAITKRKPFESEEKLKAFIKTISPNESDSNGTNLRLLGIYLRTWQNHETKHYVSDVTEEDIYCDFISTYKLNDSLGRDTVLLFISSLFQFDVPVPSKAIRLFLKNEEINNIDLLNILIKEGLLIMSRDFYYLPHSVEAYFLFKAICYKQDENYIEKTDEFVIFFIDDFILRQRKPRNYENDFVLLMQGLVERKDEFHELIIDLTEWNRAREIVMKINPGFLLLAANTKNHSKEEILEWYKNEKDSLIKYIFQMSPGALVKLCLSFKNHLEYDAIFTDIFTDNNKDKISDYLKYWSSRFGTSSLWRIFPTSSKIIRIIREISPDLYEKYLGPSPVQYDYTFNTTQSSPNQYCISNYTIRRFHHYCQNEIEKAEWRLDKINKEGFYFKNCSWRHLGQMISFIRSIANDKNMDICRNAVRRIVRAIMDEIRKNPYAVQKATSEQLSLFFSVVLNIDEDEYKALMKDKTIVNEVKNNRLLWFDYSSPFLYLISHFYFQDWCKNEINKMIDKADLEQQKVVKEWHDKVLKGLDDQPEKIEKDSLLAYIHNKPYCQ